MTIHDLEERLTRELHGRAADVDTAIRLVARAQRQARGIRRRRRIAAGVLVAGLVAVAVPSLLLDGRPTSVPLPASPNGRTVLLPPLCWNPSWQGRLDPPYQDTSAACPSSTPAGTYGSAFIGFNEVQPFSFTLPDGWEVAPVPGRSPGRLEVAGSMGWMLRARDSDVGLSLLISPARADGTRIDDVASWTRLLEARYGVEASPVTDTTFADLAARQVDLRPGKNAELVSGCPVGDECLPLLRDFNSPAVLAGLRPATTSRLIVTKPMEPVMGYPLVIWVWDLDGDGPSGDDTVQRVLDSITVGDITPVF